LSPNDHFVAFVGVVGTDAALSVAGSAVSKALTRPCLQLSLKVFPEDTRMTKTKKRGPAWCNPTQRHRPNLLVGFSPAEDFPDANLLHRALAFRQ